MNCYAYPIIFDAVKDRANNHISIFLYDGSIVRIFKKDEFIILKDSEGLIYADKDTFNFNTPKPIENVLIIYDKYGPINKEIFVRNYWKAAVAIQRAWKRSKFSL